MTLRCLIVDDNLHFLEAARGLLEREGVTVVGLASTGTQALQRANQLHPDVALLDIALGGESELARRLQRETSLPPSRVSRVILISTYADYAEQEYAEMIADSPTVGFLSKSALSADAIRRLLGPTGDTARTPTA
jgi:CheY-like chemotaxis protein